uniref:Uncharacterized protein n=1 Tax=Helicotheca tamesis TaxID=374047 RepID=A0A7S2IEK0_9STRA|mmetsp:Transcript_852/g.1147  ORF Transcript_852/g.1147 Transcript_852/m.1147 type:complete len:385 (+) Transcript_852:81-1235(+)
MITLCSSEAIKQYIMESQSKHRRMPCKARSVPADHTAENAYFNIPPNAAHGLTLVCSYPECSLSGGRFKFCAVCDIPVAKRNFARRHSHGLLTRRGQSSIEHEPGLSVELVRQLCGPLAMPGAKQQKGDTEEADSSNAASTPAEMQISNFFNTSKDSAGMPMPMTSLDLSERQGPPICHDITPSEPKPKSGDWVETPSLLQDQGQKGSEIYSLFQQGKPEASCAESRDGHESRKRPRDQMTSNYKPSDETPHKGEPQTEGADVTVMYLTSWEREWNTLLYNRPPTSDKKRMHKWMEKVLSQSECFADEDSEDDSPQEQQQVTRRESTTDHPAPSVPIIQDASTADEEVKIAMPDTASSRGSFSAHVAPLPLRDDEPRISAPKAA